MSFQIRTRPISERHASKRLAAQQRALRPSWVLAKAVLGGAAGLALGYVVVELLTGTTPAELLQRAEFAVSAFEAWLK